MAFSQTVTVASGILSGVSFTIRRMGLSRRTAVEADTLKLRQRQREIQAEFPMFSLKEKELQQQLVIAREKYLRVPDDQAEAVLADEIGPLADELRAAGHQIPIEEQRARASLDEEFKLLDAQRRAAWVKAGLLSISGGEVDGLTAEQLLDFGPPALAEEICGAIESGARLVGDTAKNLQSPGTSAGQADSTTSATTAPTASAPETSPIETASAISPAA